MKILKGILASTLFASTMAKADPPATHGMLLFGNKVTYASHLPMFHSPHDYQLIMKLKMADHPQSHTLQLYEQAKSDGPTLFTLVPEAMDLTQLIDGNKTSFEALIFVGHFERGGQNIGGVKVDVEKVVYASKLNVDQPASSFASYLLFGEHGEYFGAHVIKSKPSFDTIISVSQPMKLLQPNCGRSNCPDPVPVPVSDSQLPVTVTSPLTTPPQTGDFLGALFGTYSSVESIIYLEENELEH